MKLQRIKKKFLDEIKEFPSVSRACQRCNISRQSFYRWCKEDSNFKNEYDISLGQGVDLINELAESKIFTKINNGELPAIRYWLDNNSKKYRKPREKTPLLDSMIDDDQISSITITMLDQQGKEVELNKKKQLYTC